MKYSKIKFLTFFAIICSIGLAPINDAYAAIDNPTATSSFDDGDSDGSGGTFDELDGAWSITTVVIGSNTYALVVSYADDGVQIIDITTPGSPKDIASFEDGGSDGSGGTFDELDGAGGITTVVIGSNTYALVASSADDGVQIIDITTPGSPTATASFDDGGSDGSGGTFDELDGANGITTVVIGSNTYALVASSVDDGVQIIDITTPGSPTATASFDDGDSDGSGGTFDELDYAHGITTVVIGSNTYALVTSSVDNGVQIIGLDVVTADSTTTTKKSSDCYDCKPPVLQSSHITILTNDYVVATGDDPIHITANVGDKVTILLNFTDNKFADTIPFAALYTNYQEKPSDMSAYYANNFDKWKHVSTSFYEWNIRSDDVPYDYDGTVSWSDNTPTVVTGEITDENYFMINDNNVLEYFMMPFTFTMSNSMDESAISAKIYDAAGNRLHVTLPVTLQTAGNDPLNFDHMGKQKVLGFYDESVLSEMVQTWSESESDTKQLSSILGISDESLPAWSTNLATWVADDKIDSANMIVAVEYLINQ